MTDAKEAHSAIKGSIMDSITRYLSRPTTHYVLALLLLALAAIASHSVLVQSLSELDEDSIVINTSGRQRMLSEQTFRLAGEFVVTTNPGERLALKNQLQSSYELMRESHEGLAGDVRQIANPSSWDDKLASAYFGDNPSLDDRLSAYFTALETVLATDPDALDSSQSAYRSLVRAHRAGLLSDLDSVVQIYEQKAQARLQASENLHINLMFGMLALLLAEALFIFRPLIRRQSETNEGLLEARDEAQAELSARTNILAAVSHEIRTPLGGVLGIIDQLKRERSPTERDRALELVEDSCEALLDTLDAILQQSRLDQGADALSEDLFSPRALAQRVAELFRPVARRKALNIEVSTTTNRKAIGDAARVQQVLANLVSNAVKFTHSGAVTIFVQEPASGSKDWTFVVSDTGAGMDEKRAKAIFDRFGHSADDTLGRAVGAGLGLSITRDLIEAMGGRIEVESELGKGSSFTVLIPLDQPPELVEDVGGKTNNGCVGLLIDRASDRVQAEALAVQSGYAVYDLCVDPEPDTTEAGALIIITDTALLPQLNDDLVSASRQIIVLGDDPQDAPPSMRNKIVFVSHNQLGRSLGDELKRQAA